jgi:L-ascorbate metabolism protein UlaG (beta-lactamase superfamily)
MQLQLLRNATLKLGYAGSTLLIDPFFAPKHSLPSFTGRSPNPLVDLPVDIDKIIDGVELVIVSHLHTDHFDPVAQEAIAKDMPLICQPGDEAAIRKMGFSDVTPLDDTLSWKGIHLHRQYGSHGLGPVVDKMGQVMGFTLSADEEPDIYWTGDTVLYPPVRQAIEANRPDIIITHSCGARWDGDLIVMDAAQTITVCELSPQAIVIATHMEALDHATVERADLRAQAQSRGIGSDRLLIPADGEVLVFEHAEAG